MATITVAEHAGFCFGVKNAIKLAEEELEKAGPNGKVYCLGPLIHNKEVLKELGEKGLVTAECPDDVPEGSRVIIRAHGEPASTYEKAEKRGLTVVDGTCPLVEKVHRIAEKAGREGRVLILFGDASHAEIKGITGWTEGPVFAVQSAEEVRVLADKIKADMDLKDRPVTAAAQTTLTADLFNECASELKAFFPDAVIENTICKATSERQRAAEKLARESDLMVVIGDSSSSNSKKLLDICVTTCKNTVFVEKSNNLPLHDLKKYNRIGVAASASAPERIIKEVVTKMSEVFTKDPQNEEANDMSMYMDQIEKSLKLPARNEIVDGTVVQVTKDHVVVNLGCKKDGILFKNEVNLEEGQELTDAFAEGDAVQAKVIKTDDGDGNILLSKKRLQSSENWDEIIAACDNKDVIEVTVIKEVNKGVIANYKEISGFIPMSLLADHYVETADEFIGKTLPVKVTKVDPRRNKAVFSHKEFLAEERRKKIADIWNTLNVGDVVEGKVMRFTDYGAFVDIGGIDGLLHISEISWGKLKHPQEVLSIGQVINVKILNMNAEKGKISLGLKQNNPEPWSVIDEQYQVGQVITGKVVQIKEYGAFIEIAPGLDGLVHISEISHKRIGKVADELSIGQMVQAKILEIDKDRRRISLSIKATLDPEAPAEEAPAEPAPAEEAPAEAAPAEEAAE
jgi:4-hydroxy-3-methylbut-2-enyl diphosphate reductase